MKKIFTSVIIVLSLLLSSCDFISNIFEDKDASVNDSSSDNTDTNTSCPGAPEGDGNGSSNDSADTGNSNDDNNDSNNNNNGDSSGNTGDNDGERPHVDADDNGICDVCLGSVIVEINFFAINDFHGKMADSDTQPGADELSLYLKTLKSRYPNAVFISSGDMWQGGAESNLSRGLLVTEWMNEIGFTSMTLGNHEYDWGSEYIRNNAEAADFPLLAINVYDSATNQRVDYCESSVMVDVGGVTVGIIGAIGDCYSSISADKCADVYFKTGSALTSLIKAESQKLRNAGADYIVLSFHEGHDSNSSSSTISNNALSDYYDTSLSSGGYVDVVFEGHSHRNYALTDSWGVYHLQGGGDNSGFVHFSVSVNFVTGSNKTNSASTISNSVYKNLEDDPFINELFEKYKDVIAKAYEYLGYNPSYIDDSVLEQKIADLYYQLGELTWGDDYDIVLGGGFLRTRSPYNLYAGEVTYADLMMLFPFDNEIVLCSIKGSKLKSQFFNNDSSDYYICYGDFGETIKNNINDNATYYVVVDSYTAYYKYNGLTIIERYDTETFARDLLSEYIKAGKMW